MDATQFFVQQQARKFEGDCRSAAAQVGRLTTIPEVVRAARVTAPAVIRGATHSLPGYRTLSAAVDRRLEELVAQQLEEVRKETDLEKRRLLIGRLRLQEWEHLRGAHAMQWRIADREAQLLLANRS